jgi:hypothetical protein
MTRRTILSLAGLTSFSLGFCSPLAQALPFVTDDPILFMAAVDAAAPATLIDFESEAPIGAQMGGGVSTLVLPGLTLVAQDPALKILDRAYTGNHNTTVGGSNYLSIDTDTRAGTGVWFQFDQPIYALGFNLIDHDTGDVSLNIGSAHYLFPDLGNGESVFFGLVLDDPLLAFDELYLSSERDGQFALDDLFFAGWRPAAEPVGQQGSAPVAEPEMLSLLGLAMVGLMGWRKRAHGKES